MQPKISDSTCKVEAVIKTAFEAEKRASVAKRKTFEAKWARVEIVVEVMCLRSALREAKGRNAREISSC